MPRRQTLGETVDLTERRIAEFRHDPNYESLHRLSNRDHLIVPDIAYSLTHHFHELLGKELQNPNWQAHSIFEALQVIDFALSRTGVILKYEARVAMASGSRGPRDRPRHLHFDRPFLIYVKKRGTDTPPFFVMWVDNAELMQRY